MADVGREQTENQALRIVFMVLFWIVLRLGYWLTAIMALVQWVMRWFEDTPNPRLRRFSRSLSVYQHQILDYLLFNCEQKPFPFSDWPSDEPTEEP